MSEVSVNPDHLPVTWVLTSLGAVVDYGSTTKVEPSQISGADWVLELEDIEKDSSKLLQRMTFSQRQSKSTKSRFQAGDVLYGKLRPYLNKVLIADQPGYCTTEVVPIKAGARLDNRYLFYWLKHPAFLKFVEAESHGMNMPRLGTASAKAAPFVLAPRNEQTRIADQLDKLLARIQACNDRLDAIPALLKRFRQTVLSAAISGELYTAPSSLEETASSDDGFLMVFLSSVLAEPLRNGKSVRDGYGLPVLRLTSIKTGGIDLSKTKLGDWSGIPDTNRFLIQNGDYLVSRGNGSRDLVARGGLVCGCEEDIAFPDTMIRIRPDIARVTPRYLNYVWSSQLVRLQIERVARTTAGIWKVSQQDLENVRFPLPTLGEQQEIVRRVEALFKLADHIEARYTAARTQAQRITPLLLSKAFRGELVQQDPQDEPASVLLERVAATPSTKMRTSRGRPRLKPERQLRLPELNSDQWASLTDGAWAAPTDSAGHATMACVVAVLRACDKPVPEREARLAALFSLQPRLFTAVLPNAEAEKWCRLVGDEARPVPEQVLSFQPAINSHWGRAIKGMRARGDLVEAGTGNDITWTLGVGAAGIETAGWPDGRAGFVVAYLRAHDADSVLSLLDTSAQEFANARAA